MGYAIRIYEAFKDDQEKAKILAEFIEMVEEAISNNQVATRNDITITELKLTKEIEQVRNEIKETELKLTKEIEQVRKEMKETELKLIKEIEQVRNEIKETELKLTKEIEQVRKDLTIEIYRSKVSTIRWVVALFIAQTMTIIGVIVGLLKLFI